MIDYADGLFRLETLETAYLFRITAHGHLEHIYYGARLPQGDAASLMPKRNAVTGSSILYDESDDTYCLDTLCLEWSGTGCGDYRQTPCELRMPDGTFASDFLYVSHEIHCGYIPMETLPSAYGEDADCDTLAIRLKDVAQDVFLTLYYTVYPNEDVMTRRAVLENGCAAPLSIRRLMSMQMDMIHRDYSLVTFDGAWIKETHRHDRRLQYGMFVNGSVTGASSNRHNPGFLLYEEGACEQYGNVYGFNLVYSGNHIGIAELSPSDLVRVQIGIHPQNFDWTLQSGERFETPEAVMTFSSSGFSGMSAHFHDFVNRRVVRGDWKGKERPVLLNNWEAHFFQFSRGKLLKLARQAKRLGVEYFVLDDGWFGARNNDRAGLGDYRVNTKKLPRGMRAFADSIRTLGMQFGLWFEPEMVNEDSDLFRAHPEYAVTAPGRRPTLGRHQLVLDLCNPAVRDYIVDNVSRVLDDAGISYVKWDMNRHMSDAYSPSIGNQGEFSHRYILGLYDVLGRIFRPRPQILLESCSSGGNRFDLGMLCYCQQVWSSDDTDALERQAIQEGLSYLYPVSAMGAHVSAVPNQQTLRETPLPSRFNVAAFGCLGYELDLKLLTPMERREIREQIAFYKRHRSVFQYGRYYRLPAGKAGQRIWEAVEPGGRRAVAGFYRELLHAACDNDVLPLAGLDPHATYRLSTKPQRLFLKRFGGLMKHLLPIALHPDGWILRTANKLYALTDCVETYIASGAQLMQGVRLHTPFLGTGYSEHIRMAGDFGSYLYTIEKVEEQRA